MLKIIQSDRFVLAETRFPNTDFKIEYRQVLGRPSFQFFLSLSVARVEQRKTNEND